MGASAGRLVDTVTQILKLSNLHTGHMGGDQAVRQDGGLWW
jgi:hypothetical protein